MWHYVEGIQNWNPIWPRHGIRILPGPSSMWFDATGTRLPSPLFPGSDTLGQLQYIMRTGYDYSWFVLTQSIIKKEFALSGSEQNPDLTGKSWRMTARRATNKGAPGTGGSIQDPRRRFRRARQPRRSRRRHECARRRQSAASSSTCKAQIEARDREIANPYVKDTQVMNIHNARRYIGDRLIRTAKPHRILDPAHGPLIAVKLNILTRKTLGGFETDLDFARVRPATATSCRGFTLPVKPPASAAAACTATGRWKAHSSAAACFRAAMPGARRQKRCPDRLDGLFPADACGNLFAAAPSNQAAVQCDRMERDRHALRTGTTNRPGRVSRYDAELVRRARARDEAAVRSIMQANNRRLYRLARGILRNDSEAEDVVQETYVRAFTHLGSFRGDSSLATWLARIAMNEALGRLRRQRPSVEMDALAPGILEAQIIQFPLSAASEDPEKSMAQREIQHVVEHAIDELPEAFRIVFITRVIEGMNVEETAEILGLKPETVKTRLHRARTMLRDNVERKIGPVVMDAFPFAGKRCERLTEAVLKRLGLTA